MKKISQKRRKIEKINNYLVNSLIANKHEVFFYTYDEKLICKRFDDVYMKIRYDLYEKNVYYIIVKDDVIEVVLEEESKNDNN